MVYTVKTNFIDAIIPVVYVTLFFLMMLTYQENSRTAWIISVVLTLITSMCAWKSKWRRRRMITDTPTSNIASAAQGYVELIGRGQPLDDNPLISHLTSLPCLWYRWKIEKKGRKNKILVDSGESDKSFILNDGSGRCIVDVFGAEILTKHVNRWREDNYYFTEWKLLGFDKIYVVGEFRTVNNATSELNVRRDLGELLSSWKKDRDTLLGRFDIDGDGEISDEEWELARREARREVYNMHSDIRNNSSDMHIVSRPNNVGNRYFIISNIDQDRLSRHYFLLSFFHLSVFLATLVYIYWILK